MEAKADLKALETRRRKLLDDHEDEWCLKSRAIWLAKGDENTKFFHTYAKGRKVSNILWKLKGQGDTFVSSFEGLVEMGKNHFQTLFKVDLRDSSADSIRLTLHFPRFVDEKGNIDIFIEFTEEELKETLHNLQKYKSPSPNG